MHAAILSLRKKNPAHIVMAVPVAAPEVCKRFQQEVEKAICLYDPQPFYGVGMWYQNFTQMTDDEVRSVLAEAVQIREHRL